jgi:O-antigen ligase
MHDTNNDIKLLIDKNYSSSIGLRTLWLSIGIQNLIDEPILGSGVGSYKNSVKHFLEKNTINVKHDLAISNNPHNEFVSMTTQLGLFGLIIYILFLYQLFKESKMKFLSFGVFAIVLISSFFNSVFYDNVFGLFLVMAISLVYQEEFD